MTPTWDELASGTAVCPMDQPRLEISKYLYFIGKLGASSLYLERNQGYRGHCVLIYDRRHVTRIDQLSAEQWLTLAMDLRTAETAIYRALEPDHVNVESLGNAMPHLHWHIIPRFKDDGRWGGPVWTTTRAEMPQKALAEHEYAEIAKRIDNAITSGG